MYGEASPQEDAKGTTGVVARYAGLRLGGVTGADDDKDTIDDFMEYVDGLEKEVKAYREFYSGLKTEIEKFVKSGVPTEAEKKRYVKIAKGLGEGVTKYTVLSRKLENRQRSSGVLKAEICYNIARVLKDAKINTLEDFRNCENQEKLEASLRSKVLGFGEAGVNYLFMLAGDSSRCKNDTRLRKFVKTVCGFTPKGPDLQNLFAGATMLIKDGHGFEKLTVRGLDYAVWRYMKPSNKKQTM